MFGKKDKKEKETDTPVIDTPKKEDSNKQANLDIKIERLEAQQDSMKEFINAFNERFENVNEQIGELRSTTIEHEKNIGKSEAISSKAMDLVSEVHPEELMSHLAKEEAKIEALKAKIESQNSISMNIIDDLKANKVEISKFRGLEETMKLNKTVLKEITNIKKIESTIEKHSDRVETIFGETEKKFREFENIKEDVSASDEKIIDMEKLINQFDVKSKEYLTKNDVSNIDKKINKIDELINKSKEFKNNEKKIDDLVKKILQYKIQIDNLILDNSKRDKSYKNEFNDLKKDIKKQILKTTKTMDEINTKKQYIYDTYNKVEPLKMTIDILVKNEKKMINEFVQEQESLKLKLSKLSSQMKTISNKDFEKIDDIDVIDSRLSRIEKEKSNIKKIEYLVTDINDRFADKNDVKDMQALFDIKLKEMQDIKDRIRNDIVSIEKNITKLNNNRLKEYIAGSVDSKIVDINYQEQIDDLKKMIINIQSNLKIDNQKIQNNSSPILASDSTKLHMYPKLDNLLTFDKNISSQISILQKYIVHINDKVKTTNINTYPKIDIDKTINNSIKKYEIVNENRYNLIKADLDEFNKIIKNINFKTNDAVTNINFENIKNQIKEKDKQILELNKQISDLRYLIETKIKGIKNNKQEPDNPTIDVMVDQLQELITSR